MKYIPEPIRIQLDANISEIEPAEMIRMYLLLRESGWRGTDVLNLRYDNCLEYLSNTSEQKYNAYLCAGITKTGIELHKIPIRQEMGDIDKALAEKAEELSYKDNNPDKYLLNTYEGKTKDCH